MRVAHPTRPKAAVKEGDPLLELKGLKVAYGGIHALKGIDLRVAGRPKADRSAIGVACGFTVAGRHDDEVAAVTGVGSDAGHRARRKPQRAENCVVEPASAVDIVAADHDMIKHGSPFFKTKCSFFARYSTGWISRARGRAPGTHRPAIQRLPSRMSQSCASGWKRLGQHRTFHIGYAATRTPNRSHPTPG